MGYTNGRSIIKWWYPQTNKSKNCSSEMFDEHNNKFGIGWSPGSEHIFGKNISTLTTLQIDLSNHPFIKYDIFEIDVNFPPRCNLIGIVTQYCKHHKISYLFHSTNKIPRNHAFPAINKANFWILVICRKEQTTVQQFLEAI